MNELSKDISNLNISQKNETNNQNISQMTHNNNLLSKYKNSSVFILYASQTGTSERFAKGLYRLLKKIQISSHLSDMASFSTNDFCELANLQNVFFIFLVSTFGNGEPPDNGQTFFTFLKTGPKLSRLKYNIFALGDKSYDHFCKFGKSLDKILSNLGAKSVLPIVKADANNNIDSTYISWRNEIIKVLSIFEIPKHQFDESHLYDYKIQTLNEQKDVFTGEVFKIGTYSKQKKPYHAKNPFLAKVLLNKELIKNGDRSCKLISLDLSNSALRYLPGDHCAVYPSNQIDIVEKLGNLLNIDLNIIIDAIPLENSVKTKPFPMPCSIKTAFTYYLDITSPVSMDLLIELSDYEMSESDKAIINKLINPNDQSFYNKYIICDCRNIVSLLEELTSIRPRFDFLVQNLPRLNCRYYSISSAQNFTGNELHITVAIVDFITPNNKRKIGVASNFLKDRNELNDMDSLIPISIRRAPHFNLPAKHNIPIIMIGCGAGVAPFRGFIQYRATMKNSPDCKIGEMILFFGCRNKKSDFLFEEEFKNFVNDGVLTNLFTAFSRDSIEKYYITEEIRKNGSLFWELLQKGAYIYVCGASKISAGIKESVNHVIKNYGSLDDERVKNYIKNLNRQNRYCIDVW